jgi:hypothetical protein
VGAREEGAVGADESPRSDGDRTRVDKGAVAVDEDAFTESGVACSQLGEFWPLNRKAVVALRVGGTT